MTLPSLIDNDSEGFKANAAHNRALAEQLRSHIAKTAMGGSEAARRKHTARGKLLVRERINRLLDPGSPFLEIAPLAGGIQNGQAVGEPRCQLVVDEPAEIGLADAGLSVDLASEE